MPANTNLLDITVHYKHQGTEYWMVLSGSGTELISTQTAISTQVESCLHPPKGNGKPSNATIYDVCPCSVPAADLPSHVVTGLAAVPSDCCYLVNNTWVCY
jgi:hypothetical protein